MQLFDAHMHYSDTHGPAFDAVRERHGVGACTLACIPQMGVCSTVPDALYYKAVHPEGTVYVMGGLERSAWFLHEGDAAALGEDLVAQAGALLAAGCDGIKLLEGKPDIRRNFPIPDFDTPAWEPFWRWAEEQRVPILWHVNDPEEFWDASRINPYAKSEGWFYGPETIKGAFTMPNRPICAEDALLSETPMPPEQILRYLDRIGLRDAVPPPPTLETLRRLQSAHLLYVPYENLDLLRGAITSLEHGALFEKIVEKRRGGLCFELNGLFCWLLCSLGYQVTSYAGRFIYPSEAGIQMRRHRVLVVTLEGKRYLTETGMNSEGPRAPLVLAESEAQWDGVTEYRFSRDAFWGWVLWKRSPGGAWRRLYGFTEEPQLDIDFIMPSLFCDVHPMSPFNKTVRASIFLPDAHLSLRDSKLTWYRKGAVARSRSVAPGAETAQVLWDVFGLRAPEDAAL